MVEGQAYYNDDANLKRVPIAGGAPVVVGSRSLYGFAVHGNLLVGMDKVGDDDVWDLVSAPLDAPDDIKVIAANTGYASKRTILTDGTNAYFASDAPPLNIYRVPLAGGTPEVLVAGGSAREGAIHQGHYYWFDQVTHYLERVPLAGGAREKLFEAERGGPLIVDGGTVYWSDLQLLRTMKWSQATGKVQLSGRYGPYIALAGNTIYYANADVSSVTIDGSTHANLLCRTFFPEGMGVSDDHLVLFLKDHVVRVAR